MQQHENQKRGRELSGPRPGEFPLGSDLSRAAARAMLDSRAVESGKLQLIVVTRLDDRGPGLPTNFEQDFEQILRESGLMPSHGTVVVRLDTEEPDDGVRFSVGDGIERVIRNGVITTN
jgi:hypothetical protein